MSQNSEEQSLNQINILFQNSNLSGYDIARNNQLSNMIKRDSTDFALQVIKHSRGRQIVCELIDVALRPRLIVAVLERERMEAEGKGHQLQKGGEKDNKIEPKKISVHPTIQSLTDRQTPPSHSPSPPPLAQSSPPLTTIIYNAIQILTNQYEEFVQFIFEQTSKQLIDSGIKAETTKVKESFQINSKQKKEENRKEDQEKEDQEWEDCVIMESGYPELTRNEEDEVLQKMNSMTKLSHYDNYRSLVLDRMFMLFDEPVPIEETPVSYLNKIMLQFVYQKPEEIMRYFYCEEKQPNNEKTCHKLRTIARHLYNSSVIQFLVHIMELESDGNFFHPQKIEMLKAITEEVFTQQSKNKANNQLFKEQEDDETIAAELLEDKIANYLLFLKTLYQKLEDRYEQEKYLVIFKSHFSDVKSLANVIAYFKQYNYFDISGLPALMIQTLKMDQLNFKLHKVASQEPSPFGSNNFSFHGKNEQSTTSVYDLKLNNQILDLVQDVLTLLTKKYQHHEGTTIKMIEYYDFIHCWLNVTVETRQEYARKHLITPQFINDCLFKLQYHQKSTILHNGIKNILVDFLPNIGDSIKIVLAPECELLEFIENYLEKSTTNNKNKKNKKKCYENQLYHIGKAVLSIWQQQKMLSVIQKTEDDEEDQLEKMPLEQPNSPTTDGQNIVRFQRLKSIIESKQQFYDHLICGDPRKMGEYQEEESSQIIMASSFKNFFKPSLNSNDNFQLTTKPAIKQTKDRYADDNDDDNDVKESSKDKQVVDLKHDTNLKTDPKFKSLKIGLEHNNNSLFESAISPLNANRSHTFNFDFDALPLDSDNEEAISQEEDLPAREGSGNGNEDQIKLMQENIENFDFIAGNILRAGSNILSSNNSISQERNQPGLLNCDNHRRDQLSKSIDIQELNMGTIRRVDSYVAIQSPRKQSGDDALSLGMDSRNQGSKISEELQEQRNDNFVELVPSFLKEDLKENSTIKMDEKENDEIETVDTNFVNHYSSYLKYDADKLCMDVQ